MSCIWGIKTASSIATPQFRGWNIGVWCWEGGGEWDMYIGGVGMRYRAVGAV
jgi:hypothetical protein